MTNYIPIPEWDGTKWVPKDHRHYDGDFGYLTVDWPEGFDPLCIPLPRHQIGDWVNFEWSGGERFGQIRSIQLHGGQCDNVMEAIDERYIDREPDYDIYWNGHGRGVRQSLIKVKK